MMTKFWKMKKKNLKVWEMVGWQWKNFQKRIKMLKGLPKKSEFLASGTDLQQI